MPKQASRKVLSRSVLRTVRSAASATTQTLVDASAVKSEQLRGGLLALTGRGRCGSAAAALGLSDSSDRQRKALSHLACPPSVLRASSSDGTRSSADGSPWRSSHADGWISAQRGVVAAVRSVAGSVASPRWMLAGLSTAVEASTRLAVAKNHRCQHSLLARLAGDDDDTVRAAVAAHPHCPQHLLGRLEDDVAANVAAEAVRAQHAISSERLAELVRRGTWQVLAAVASRADCPDNLFELLGANWDPDVCAAVAANPNCDAQIIRELATHSHRDVRVAAASHDECVEELAEDSEPDVRAAAASHPECPAECLEELASDEYWWVRAAAAAHRECPPEHLEQLVRDDVPEVVKAAASNPSLRPALLDGLPDAGLDVMLAIAARRDCGHRLAALADDFEPLVRAKVAEHPAAAVDILRTLACDTSSAPRLAARDELARRRRSVNANI